METALVHGHVTMLETMRVTEYTELHRHVSDGPFTKSQGTEDAHASPYMGVQSALLGSGLNPSNAPKAKLSKVSCHTSSWPTEHQIWLVSACRIAGM